MKIKVHSIKIPEDDPFDNDKLDRESEIKPLSNLIENINPPAVLSINSKWGTGKTTFIKMWKSYLDSKKVVSLYFNAGETDFTNDPLVAFLGEMNTSFTDLLSKSGKSNEGWKKTKRIGTHLVRKGIPALIKIGTSGILDAEAVKLLEGLSKDAINAYEDTKSSIKEFKINLSKVVKEVCTEKKPLIIFVDELDRCRPTYAIELLERIKHLFEIENLIFVLSLDKEQLSHSIKSVYGSDFEATGYLRRFIDIEYSLKTPDIKPYLELLFNTLGLESFLDERKKYRELENEKKILFDNFYFIANAYKLTIREVEQIVSRVNVVFKSTNENPYIYPSLLPFLIITREKNRTIYDQYLAKENGPKEMIEHLYSLLPKSQRIKSHICSLIEGFLINAKTNDNESNIGDALKTHKETITSKTATRYEKKYSDNVVYVAEHFDERQFDVSLKSLVDRIEMLEQFNFDNS